MTTKVEGAPPISDKVFSWQKEKSMSFCLDKMSIMFAYEPLAKESHRALLAFFSAVHHRLQLSEVTWRGQQMDA